MGTRHATRRTLWVAAAAALLGSVLLPATRIASATLINFDGLPHDTVVTTQYAGVEFNEARIVRCSSDPSACFAARSGQNALRPAIEFEFDNEPLVMLFDEPQLSVSLYATAAQGVRTVTLRAFGPSGQVDTDVRTIGGGWWIFRVSHPDGIVAASVTAPTDNQFAIDDLSLEPLPPPTPPPTQAPTPTTSADPDESQGESPSTRPTADPTATPADDGGPRITILTPRAGQAFSSASTRVELSYEVRDDGRIVHIEEWLWHDAGDGTPAAPVFDEPWIECSSAAACFGTPYRGREPILLPAPGLYVVGVRARDDDGNVSTEFVSITYAAPVDMWVMGMEWNQAVQDVVYTDLDRAPNTVGAKRVPAGVSRVPLVRGKPMLVRVYIGLRRPSVVRVPPHGLSATGSLTVTVRRGDEITTTVLEPVVSPDCANHLGEERFHGCVDDPSVPLSFGRPRHPTSPDTSLIDPFHDVSVEAASQYELDLIWRRVRLQRTLNFLVPGELLSTIQPGDRVTLRSDVQPLNFADERANDNRFVLTVESIAPPADLFLNVVNVEIPGDAGAPASDAQLERALDGIMHLVPYSDLDAEEATPFAYNGHFKRLRAHVLGVEVADVYLDQCASLWVELAVAFPPEPLRTTLGFTPPQLDLIQHEDNGGGTDCNGIGWRVPDRDGRYQGGIAHTTTPSDLTVLGTTAEAYVDDPDTPEDERPTNEFWDLVSVGAQELYHAHLDRRHVGDFHGERSGCFLDDDALVELLAQLFLQWSIDSACVKPAAHQHGAIGEYPMPVEPLRGDIGAMGIRIEGTPGIPRLTLYDPCPIRSTAVFDPDDSIPWLNERWSVISSAHDCRRTDAQRPHDFLSYGEHRWTSVEQFSPLNIGNHGPVPVALPSLDALRTSSHLSPGAAAEPGIELTDDPPLRLWGVVTADGSAGIGEVMPIDALSATPLALETGGEGVYLQVTRTDGTRVLLEAVPSVQSAHGGDLNAFFLAEVPPGPPVDRIDLMLDERAWTSIEASESAPTVSVLEPNGGEQWSGDGPRTIRWEASDVDGDDLIYRVEYSADAGTTWLSIAAAGSATSIEIDAGRLPAGAEALVRVVASDGLRFAADVSDATFCVRSDGECVARIVDPQASLAAGFGTPVVLLGVVAALLGGGAFVAWRRRRSRSVAQRGDSQSARV